MRIRQLSLIEETIQHDRRYVITDASQKIPLIVPSINAPLYVPVHQIDNLVTTLGSRIVHYRHSIFRNALCIAVKLYSRRFHSIFYDGYTRHRLRRIFRLFIGQKRDAFVSSLFFSPYSSHANTSATNLYAVTQKLIGDWNRSITVAR